MRSIVVYDDSGTDKQEAVSVAVAQWYSLGLNNQAMDESWCAPYLLKNWKVPLGIESILESAFAKYCSSFPFYSSWGCC